MPIGTDVDGTDDNEGPHCRNCHIGANNCAVCHSDDDRYATGTTDKVDVSSAYTTNTASAAGNMTNYASQSFLRQSAVASVITGELCLDGGFSFPHRTLGANMLKDELYGIDFDGTVVNFGGGRTTNGGAATVSTVTGDNDDVVDADAFQMWTAEDRNATSIIPAVRADSGALAGAKVENLDSVCIDCHGDATYYQPNLFTKVGDKMSGGVVIPDGTYGSGEYGGYELLLKGLP